MPDFPDIPENDVVMLAQKGDDRAFEYILLKYRDLVRLKARAYFIMGAETEDLIQEGSFGLFKAVRDFNPEKSPSFFAFAELCIRRQLISALKSATRHKHEPLNNSVSLNKPLYDDPDRTVQDIIAAQEASDPETVLITREEYRNLGGKIDRLLSGFEKQVLVRYINGQSYQQIADEIGSHTKSVDNALQRVKKKLERALR